MRYPKGVSSNILLVQLPPPDDGPPGRLRIQTSHPIAPDNRDDEMIDLYRPIDSETSSELMMRFPRLQDISESGKGDLCFEFAKACLDDCVANHELCRQSEDGYIPNRVIYIGDGRSNLRLVEDAPKFHANYAALSYCWGDGVPTITTMASLASRKAGIVWRSLPATFQDAIVVAQKFNLKYLWIDALCIIQDSSEDWEIESAKMAAIYENAYITIAAACTTSSTQHFLKYRPDYYVSAVTLKVLDENGNRQLIKGRDIIPDDISNNGHLHGRAWAYQEKVLSTRTTSFENIETFWQCRMGRLCECGNHDETAKEDLSDVDLTSVHEADEIFDTSNVDDPRVGNPYLSWQECVEAFRDRVLTHNTDVLPALAGVADIIHRRTGSEYVAGLWKDNLIGDLLWIALWKNPTIPEVDSDYLKKGLEMLYYQAPTFSWASTNLEVCYEEPHIFPRASFIKDMAVEFSVLDAQCNLKGLNKFGEVTAGFIVVEGLLFEQLLDARWNTDEHRLDCRLCCPDQVSKTTDLSPGGWIQCIVPDTLLGEHGVSEGGKSVRRLANENSFEDFQGIVHCLGICRLQKRLRAALILGKSPSVGGAYERLGILRYSDDHEDLETLDLIDRSWERAEKKMVKIV